MTILDKLTSGDKTIAINSILDVLGTKAFGVIQQLHEEVKTVKPTKVSGEDADDADDSSLKKVTATVAKTDAKE